ncbi:hypothetical protein [Saccharopolyspora shandongensis]|uniref:hypothetical protein n=1 Tax=Saccharopolyspora shandongensis TaxID=418495 RepID=UPI0033DFDEB3
MTRAVSASLDPAAPSDDLEPLRDVIGDARVVGIGESTHHAAEFYRLRHRLLRFLTERCGFTAYVFEAPFTEAHVIDDWVRGGPGDVATISAAGTALGLGDHPEMHAHLTWIAPAQRARRAAAALRRRPAGLHRLAAPGAHRGRTVSPPSRPGRVAAAHAGHRAR